MAVNVDFGSRRIEGVAALTISNDPHEPKKVRIQALTGAGGTAVSTMTVSSGALQVRVRADIETVKSSNCATIYGNAEKVTAGNCLFVEGYVRHTNKMRLDKSIRVLDGVAAWYNSSLCDGSKPPRQTSMRVTGGNGKLGILDISVSGISCEVVVHGSVREVAAGNCVNVKGTVNTAETGNRVFSTQGKSEGKIITKADWDKRRAEIDKSAAELYASLLRHAK